MLCFAGTLPYIHVQVNKTFSKNVQGCRDGSAKTTATRCRDRAYKHCTNNPIPTSFFVRDIFLYVVRLLGDNIVHEKKM